MPIQFNPKRAPVDRYLLPTVLKGSLPKYFLTLGAYSYTGPTDVENVDFTINISIGRFSSLADRIVYIAGLNHPYKNSVTTYPFDDVLNEFIANGKTYIRDLIPNRKLFNKYQIIIGNDVWIGNDVTIMGGVHIGSGAIIGTRSVVGSDIPPYAVAVGNPARVVKYRFDEETRKKFMAVKWWNWDIDKICANVHKMYDVENFLAEHYNPALENLTENLISNEVENYRAEGRTVYTFIADFRSPYPVWRRVLGGMLKSTDKNAVMIFYLGAGVTDKDFAEVKNFIQETSNFKNMPTIKFIPPIEGKIFSPQVLRNSTHFITSRELISVDCLDWIYDKEVKILSALDENIFEGEPIVDWSILNS